MYFQRNDISQDPNKSFRAKFGTEVGGGGGVTPSIFDISKSQISKRRAIKQFDKNKALKTERRQKKRRISVDLELTGFYTFSYF